MPITLPPISRRRFLVGSAAAAGAALVGGPSLFGAVGESAIDPHRFALVSDTHIAADRAAAERGTNMSENLERVTKELAALTPRPAAVIVTGDLAYHTGEAADYAAFLETVRKVREAGMPMHLTLGNHDHRERFWQAVPPPAGQKRALEDRHVTVVQAERANLLILDSLKETNQTPGVCGEAQLKWLAGALDAAADKPAIVMVHHQPDRRTKIQGLLDTEALLAVLMPRKHVKALFFGHTHDWHVEQQEGLHLVNLPPTAYVFAKGKPNGWVDMKLGAEGASLRLSCLDVAHPDHGQQVELKWRA